jgi:1-deoxy-D-xylulose-5-phosphate reductoisomerase
MRQKVAVLGSTGSIGQNTLDVLSRHPNRFQPYALAAHSQVDLLFEQCVRHNPSWAAMADPAAARQLRDRLQKAACPTRVLDGPHAAEELASSPEVHTVMAAVVGAAGLRACMAAARHGKRLLLANKEALVVGGALFMQAVRKGGGSLIPIDSEHSAIFQCLPSDESRWGEVIDHIVLTASGGPFRRTNPAEFALITPEQACAHPNWVMGRKISVDSATMMNKALEVIEARWLFHLKPEQIKVLVHPQSIVHSMVVCRDQSVLAQMGTPDMRVPIAYGLAWPDRVGTGAQPLNLCTEEPLSFESPDPRRFPGLYLAWEVLQAPAGSSAILNAANEVAVQAFLEQRIRFNQIHHLNRHALDTVQPGPGDATDMDALMSLDARTRDVAWHWVQSRAH